MDLDIFAPWHRKSYDRFLHESLPALLAERLPLVGFAVEDADDGSRRVRITVGSGGRQASVVHEHVPAPDEQGVFHVDGRKLVVTPLATSERLDEAEVRCVGERLLAHIAERLGTAPADLQWDDSLLASWVPLARWVGEFLDPGDGTWGAPAPTINELVEQNWLSRCEHLRRIDIADPKDVIAEGQLHRVCPFMTPEGPNIGRVLFVARGAEIRDGRLVVVDDSPVAALGVTASMVPLLEHDDANRLLMGVNMMRQWLTPDQPEPALVQSGNEPAAPGFWCGRNLLTAFISLGPDTFEDAIVVSESAARRLSFGRALEVGDKLSNRHGTKGVVGRILPDAQMPRLPDGTPVELVFDFIGCHTRLNFGQIREAVLGRIAHAAGEPIVVPPFAGPDDATLRARLAEAGQPESGMETLTDGRDGEPFEGPSTVGYVYWGVTHHLSRDKLHVALRPADGGQLQGELEYVALRDMGAYATLAEHYHTCAADRERAVGLAEQAAAGPVEPAAGQTPWFARVARRLAAAGIEAKLAGGRLTFGLAEPGEPAIELARPIIHPWQIGRFVHRVGVIEELPRYAALAEANAAAKRMLAADAPAGLAERAVGQLQRAVHAYFDALLTPADVRPAARVLFSGRAVIAPGGDLSLEQVGLPEELAWALFGPRAAHELGDPEAVAARTAAAAAALDAVMADAWVVCFRAPAVIPSAFLAFRPVRMSAASGGASAEKVSVTFSPKREKVSDTGVPEREKVSDTGEAVVRLHPLACRMMNADFDGDQMAVFLPVTEAGRREAAERLSVAGHLRRDPALVRWMIPVQDMLWGLARLSRTADGLARIAATAGIDVAAPAGHVTAESVIDAMTALLRRDGVEAMLAAAERLMRLGFEVTRRSGASISPFCGSDLGRPTPPATDSPEAWQAHREAVVERAISCTDFDGVDFGPQVLAVRSGARGNVQQLATLFGPRGVHVDVQGRPTRIIRHGMQEGLSAQEAFDCVPGARRGLARAAEECARIGYGIREGAVSRGFNVLARALRSERPGVVFAQAAANGEADPLVDLDARLLMGMPC